MASKARRLVIANWKMYIESPKEAVDFARKLRRRAASFGGVDVALAPSLVHLPLVAAALKGAQIRVGAQTVAPHEHGAHTGEVSASMLKQSGASFAIVGHSERRAAGETDEQVSQALLRAEEVKLRSILCIGEMSRDDSGSHFSYLGEQLKRALAPYPKMALEKTLAIAYEPIWAIGKSASSAMKPEDLRETVIFIRKILSEMVGPPTALKVPVLYGGSVEGENAGELIEKGDIGGFLVGHASAALETLLPILDACKK